MKITCEREKMLAAFQTAAAVAPSRSPKPILQNIKLEVGDDKATLTATDLEIGIRIDVEGVHIEQPGSAVLPKDRFGRILSESSDEKLSLEIDGQGTTVRGERSRFNLPGEDPNEFPAVATFTDEKYIQMPGRLLREMIHRTAFATDTESSRYALGGVLLDYKADEMNAVATDGRRLARMRGPIQTIGDFGEAASLPIIPTKAVRLIDRALADVTTDVQLAVRDNDVLVKTPRATIYSRLVEGRFPKWRDVFPARTDAIPIEFTVGPLYAAVRQAMIVTSEESRGVEFKFGEGTLVLTAQSPDLGQSRVELPISYDGSPIAIILDPRFLGEFLNVLEGEKTFTLELKDSESAVVCNTDDGYRYVIMPLARDS